MNYITIALIILAIIFALAIISNGYVKLPGNNLDNKRILAALILFGIAISISVWLLVKK